MLFQTSAASFSFVETDTEKEGLYIGTFFVERKDTSDLLFVIVK